MLSEESTVTVKQCFLYCILLMSAFVLYLKIKNKCDKIRKRRVIKMIELEENTKLLQTLKQKVENLGESL